MLAPRDNLWLSADAIRAHRILASSIGGAIGITPDNPVAFAVRSQVQTEPNHCE